MRRGIVGIPQNQILREYRRDGTETCGVPAGMQFIITGSPWSLKTWAL